MPVFGVLKNLIDIGKSIGKFLNKMYDIEAIYHWLSVLSNDKSKAFFNFCFCFLNEVKVMYCTHNSTVFLQY